MLLKVDHRVCKTWREQRGMEDTINTQSMEHIIKIKRINLIQPIRRYQVRN